MGHYKFHNALWEINVPAQLRKNINFSIETRRSGLHFWKTIIIASTGKTNEMSKKRKLVIQTARVSEQIRNP